jgi:hypothetical protein
MLDKFERYSKAVLNLTQGLFYLFGASTLLYSSIHLHKLLTVTNFYNTAIQNILGH